MKHKTTPLSVKIIKTILLLIGFYFILKSGTFDELSPKDPDSRKFVLGMLFVIIALLKRIRRLAIKYFID